jgi:hypothetical protein
VTTRVLGAREAAAAFRAGAEELRPLLRIAVDRCANDLLTLIRANASTGNHPPRERHIPGTGPGPNVATGNYRRSWRVKRGTAQIEDPTLAGGQGGFRRASIAAEVSTAAVQANRLEYGFVGADARGRNYSQPPYPHVNPAADVAEARLEAAVIAAVEVVVSSIARGGRP